MQATPPCAPSKTSSRPCAKTPTTTPCKSSTPMPSPATKHKADNGPTSSSTKGT